MSLDIQLLDTTFKGLVNPEIYAADPMLAKPTGVLGIFDTQSLISWPSQAAPDATNQRWYNRVIGAAVPYLRIGNGDTADSYDPLWSDAEQSFTFSKTGVSTIAATNGTHFAITDRAVLQTIWVKPTPAFSSTGNQILLSKYSGGASGNAYALYISSGGLYVYFSNDSAAYGYSAPGQTFAGLMQIGFDWNPTSATSRLFFNGAVVATGTAPFNALGQGVNFSIGNVGTPIDLYVKRFYCEDLTTSGNDAAARVALEYKAISEIIF